MIYTITCNPSIDYVVKLPALKIGELNRSIEDDAYVAGKGVNVSYVLKTLGYNSKALGFAAGFTGKYLVDKLNEDGIDNDFVMISNGMTRINVKASADSETEINGVGPFVGEDDFKALLNKLNDLDANDIVIISGSICQGLDEHAYEKIMAYLYDKRCKVVVDATGKLLLNTLKYRPFLVKPNIDELGELFNTKINKEDVVIYARKLKELGAVNVLVSMGKDGALLVNEYDRAHTIGSAIGTLVNSVGAGDSMVAGFIAKYLQTHVYKEALLFASSVAAATAFSKRMASIDMINSIYDQMYKLWGKHKRYFFFDIDGTLTDRKTHQVVDSALVAIKKLQEANHFVAIATGRAAYKAMGFMQSVDIHNMVCSGGKGIVLNDDLVENKPLDRDKALAIIKQADSLGYGLLLMLDDSRCVYAKNDLFVKQAGYRKEPTDYIYDAALDYDKLKDIYKIYISIPEAEEDRLTLKDTLGNLRFEKEYLMFQYDCKDEGIIRMMEYLGHDIKDVVTFGDDSNDLVMFKDEWCNIAVGNATDDLKARATYVTDANVDNGIYNVCSKFGWFEKVD